MAETTVSVRVEVRVDKWLWAARFFKTRRLASEAVKAGHVTCQGQVLKASKLLKSSEVLQIRRGMEAFEVTVLALAEKRGSASQAQHLYQETEASVLAREKLQAQQKLASAYAPSPERKPDKRARRQLMRCKHG